MARPEKKSPEADPRRHRVAPALIVATLTVILSLALKSYTDLSSAYQMAIVGFGCAGALLLTRRSWSGLMGLDDPASSTGRLAALVVLVVIALVIAAVASGWVRAYGSDGGSRAGGEVEMLPGGDGR